MKKTKFKVGDKVVCIELGNKTEGAHYAREDNHQLGGEYTVTRVGSNGLMNQAGNWVGVDSGNYWHHIDSFEIKPDVLTIVLRRPVDRKAIEKFLDSKDYKQNGDLFDERKAKSRIINVHFRGQCNGERTYNGTVTYDFRTKQAIVENSEFMRDSFFDHKNIVVIKTKPSVNEAINQIKKYI